jgi:hypothetical protein
MTFCICRGKGILDVSTVVVYIWILYKDMTTNMEGFLLTSITSKPTADTNHWAMYMIWN